MRRLIHSCTYQEFVSTGGELALDFQMIIWEENLQYSFACYDNSTYDLQTLTGDAIPATHLYASWHEGLPIVLKPIPEDCYVKYANVALYMGDDRLARYLLAEADVWTLLEKHQHPNVAKFHGCVLSDDGAIEGLCSQRYPQTLESFISSIAPEDDGRPTGSQGKAHDIASILDGIVEGVKLIHSLGFVHNDLNPKNILLNEAACPKLIDFDATKRVGTSLKGSKVFTRPWGRRNTENIAMYENDYLSLGLIELYLKGEYPPANRILDPERIDPAIAAGKVLLDARHKMGWTSSRDDE